MLVHSLCKLPLLYLFWFCVRFVVYAFNVGPFYFFRMKMGVLMRVQLSALLIINRAPFGSLSQGWVLVLINTYHLLSLPFQLSFNSLSKTAQSGQKFLLFNLADVLTLRSADFEFFNPKRPIPVSLGTEGFLAIIFMMWYLLLYWTRLLHLESFDRTVLLLGFACVPSFLAVTRFVVVVIIDIPNATFFVHNP